MISRETVLSNLERYDPSSLKVGVVGSHSALDVCDGALDEGFRTFVICQRGRQRTYMDYFRAHRSTDGQVRRGLVDDGVVLDRFGDMMEPAFMESMMRNNVLFVPNRSFVSYCGIEAVEDDFILPMVGSRNMLRSEERGDDQDYYWILERADLPYPKKVEDPQDIDTLTIVKLHHKQKKLERGFFTASTPEEYEEKAGELLKQGVIDRDGLAQARMEEYVIGPVFNLDFFYSPLEEVGERVELLGIDWRFESSLDRFVRLPAEQQLELGPDQRIPEYTICGHNSATLRESLLEKAFDLAEKYVIASKEFYSPGIIGPFCLQTCVDKDLNFYIYDVAPRVGGGTNVHLSVGHPYGNSLWRTNMSTGRRLAMEIRRAAEQERLEEIVT
jgi:5-formaminoimidazole-4-carboxamide-1-(beta)-D-ribofuranosyl 5'-monophosphate synthetase